MVSLDPHSPLSMFLKESNTTVPGRRLKEKGATYKHPVVFLPGIITTGLELWQGQSCADGHFRERWWGSTLMLQQLTFARDCWVQHISLNATTWEDPEGIHLRSASGLGSADYFLGDLHQYWVWSRLIANLAVLGYDENTMHMASYDWRLPFQHLETRDHYFTRLKTHIELNTKIFKEKTYLIAHSMGGNVVNFFMHWVRAQDGDQWLETHLQGILHIATPFLGVPKTVSSLVSGEMRDSAELNLLFERLKDTMVSHEQVAQVFRTFGSLNSMWPKGGSVIWGDCEHSPPDLPHLKSSCMMRMVKGESDEYLKKDAKVLEKVDKVGDFEADCVARNASTDVEARVNAVYSDLLASTSYDTLDTERLLRALSPRWAALDSKYYIHTHEQDNVNVSDSRHWTNALQMPLPNAPSVRIVALYGVGKPTERAYVYKRNLFNCTSMPLRIATYMHDVNQSLSSGVILSDGDGTVPLVSLGYVPTTTWRSSKMNPAKMSIVVKEYEHSDVDLLDMALNLRMTVHATRAHIHTNTYLHTYIHIQIGDRTDHTRLIERFGSRRTVDERSCGCVGCVRQNKNEIGNHALITDILTEVSSLPALIEDRIVSDIEKISKRINL